MSLASPGLRLGALLVAGALGFGLARWTAPPALSEVAMQRIERQEAKLEALARRLDAPAPPSPPPSTPSLVAPDLPLGREDFRRMLREELHAALAGTPAEPSPEPREPPAPQPPTPENVTAFEKAQRLLEDSFAARRWGDAQAHEFKLLRGQLTGPQYQEVFQKLVLAINSQQLRVETTGAPF